MDHARLLEKIGTHIMQRYAEKADPSLHYHNLTHVLEVLEAATRLCDHYQLGEEDRFVVQAAVWFHDLGYLDGIMKDHEERSAAQATEWLAENGVPAALIDKINGCIMATRMPQQPKNLLEQIIADADLWQLGTEQFSGKHKLLRQELADAHGQIFDTDTWRHSNINLLESHQYHTDYARMLLQNTQQAHLDRLKAKANGKLALAATTAGVAIEAVEKKEKKEKKKKQKDDKNNIPTRGVETMFRVTMRNHMELSAMADSKANIMISVNSIIVSVVISVLFRRLEEMPYLILPTLLLLTVNVVTIVFAILAVRPKIIPGKFSVEDIKNKTANLLFFGNFHKMPLHEYEWGMNEMMRDKEYLYGNMIRDIYFLGVVLGRKYRFLHIAYNVFMYGFVIAVIVFLLAMIL